MLKRTVITVAGVVALLGSIAYTRAKESKDDAQPDVQIVAPDKSTDKAADKDEAADKSADTSAEKQAPQYWIGVHCVAPVPEMIRAHVDVPGDSGIFVAHVLPKGPAAEAGIQRHDIILAVGDKPAKNVADLVTAVGRSEGKKLTLKILRGGKQLDIAVTPQKRPAEFSTKGGLVMPPGSKWHKLGKWFEHSQPGKDGRPPLRMRFMHPGMILPPLPPGMTVTVTRKDDQPAKIVVEKGDKRWELTADDLDKLPDDIRPHVERMVGTHTSPGMMSPGALRDKLKMPAPSEIEKSVQENIQKQIDAMNRQMKKLERMADELRREHKLPDSKRPEMIIEEEQETKPEAKSDKKSDK